MKSSKEKIFLCSSVNPLGPSRRVKAAVRKAVKTISSVPPQVPPRLFRFFSSKFGTGEENIIFANSSHELFAHVLMTVRPGRIVTAGPALRIFEGMTPGYEVGVRAACASGESRFEIPVQEIGAQLKGSDLLYIANPNRVTGRVTAQPVIDELTALARDRGATVLLDETLIWFVKEKGPFLQMQTGENVMTLRTTGCFYGLPGLELAYVSASKEFIARLETGRHWTVSGLAVAAGITALKDRVYATRVHEYVSGEKAMFRRWAEKREGFEFLDSESNIFLIRHPFPDDPMSRALEKGGFMPWGLYAGEGLPERTLSISVMKHDHNVKLLRILRELDKGLGKIVPHGYQV